MDLNNSSLHHCMVKHIIDVGRAPSIVELSRTFNASVGDVQNALIALQEYHGVVLHPVSLEVWVMHPFSMAPTNFWIEAEDGGWWGNCAWCSLGAAALLDRDLTITTSLGGESKRVIIDIRNGQISNKDLYIHFPIPMSKAWENVTYTCSTMLMFESESDIADWCRRHGMSIGDIQPMENVWEFSKVWYGNHLNRHWVKWSVNQAREMFARFNLDHSIWHLPSDKGRF